MRFMIDHFKRALLPATRQRDVAITVRSVTPYFGKERSARNTGGKDEVSSSIITPRTGGGGET